ncbi:MAG: sigma-54 interaction domain-containing protein [Flavobacteriales bacterium]
MQNLQPIKQRFSIIGNDSGLNRALQKAVQIAPTDISVLVIGESGVGKEFIPKIIHSLSNRKHNQYIAVNCGAIPEGTIDSELFGHEKGAFTGADKTRKGYFEVADGGTIFLDEVGELPLSTQVRLLRVLEIGEFIKVGSSQPQKTNVRVVAATNVNVLNAVQKGKFREDLYYRLNTVQIDLPPLRERKQDISLLFRKFASDFADKYKMPPIQLDSEATRYLENFRWPGNIRQLRNFVEQISVVEENRTISLEKIHEYLPYEGNNLPILSKNAQNTSQSKEDFSNERELLYKVLFDMKKDLNDLKSLTLDLMQNRDKFDINEKNEQLIKRVFQDHSSKESSPNDFYEVEPHVQHTTTSSYNVNNFDYEEAQLSEESLSLQEKEEELIKKALQKNNGRRKDAARELGISERTLYRKIKQFGI